MAKPTKRIQDDFRCDSLTNGVVVYIVRTTWAGDEITSVRKTRGVFIENAGHSTELIETLRRLSMLLGPDVQFYGQPKSFLDKD